MNDQRALDPSTIEGQRQSRAGNGRLWRRVLGVVKLGLILAAFYLALPSMLGGRTTYTIVSGHSMDPTYHTLDLAVTFRHGTPAVGDVIVYRVPKGEPGAGAQVIHRVIGGDAVSGYVTKGDNREGPDIWRPRQHDVVGTVVLLVPQGGRILATVFNIANIGVVALGFLAWAFWPRRDEAVDDGVPATP